MAGCVIHREGYRKSGAWRQVRMVGLEALGQPVALSPRIHNDDKSRRQLIRDQVKAFDPSE
jgi:hypothetical protein